MAEVFLCQTGQLTESARRNLRKAGIVVVEVTDPSKCQFVRATEEVPSGRMLWAAMNALSTCTGSGQDSAKRQREQFALNVASIIKAAS